MRLRRRKKRKGPRINFNFFQPKGRLPKNSGIIPSFLKPWWGLDWIWLLGVKTPFIRNFLPLEGLD